jgi:HTH-type transcriptional regulator/antitoxin HipB
MTTKFPVTTSLQLATHLKALRTTKGLSQQEVGQLLGVSQKRIAQIEAKPERTSFYQLSRLLSILGGRIEITLTDEKKPSSSTGEKQKTSKTTIRW